MLMGKDDKKLFDDWNNTEVDYPLDQCLNQLFENQSQWFVERRGRARHRTEPEPDSFDVASECGAPCAGRTQSSCRLVGVEARCVARCYYLVERTGRTVADSLNSTAP